jgi:hypothetical protein
MRIKQAEFKQPWAFLKKHQPIVLFGANLGQPIVPSRPDALCDQWRTVPSGKNYLVATGRALLHIFQGQDDGGAEGSRLEKQVEWVQEEPVMQSHRLGCRDCVSHTTTTRREKPQRSSVHFQ